jgi:putative transcriptional regulator
MKDELFNELLESLKQGAAIKKGTVQTSRSFEFPETEVRALREQFGLSQDKFARLVGISVGTLRNWEQGRRKPEGPARVLLLVASRHPEALLDIGMEQSQRADNLKIRVAGCTKKLHVN